MPNVERTLINALTREELAGKLNLPELMPTVDVLEGGIVFSDGEGGKTQLTTEFPGDVLYLGFGLAITLEEPMLLEGQVSLQEEVYNLTVHRFRGRVTTALGYVFIGEGDDLNLLTFVRIPNVGYIYLRGIGQVILPSGETVKLGQ
mgnify:CR=1 FL=1